MPPSDGFLAIESFADVGFATPEAAFQTLQWVMHHGQEDRMQYGLLTPPGRLPEGGHPVGMDMVFATSSGGEDPRVLASDVGEEKAIVQALPDLKGSRVLGRTENGPGEVTLTVENEHADGTRLQVPMTFRKVGSEWKLASTMVQMPTAPAAEH